MNQQNVMRWMHYLSLEVAENRISHGRKDREGGLEKNKTYFLRIAKQEQCLHLAFIIRSIQDLRYVKQDKLRVKNGTKNKSVKNLNSAD